jgi:hypothetical protein
MENLTPLPRACAKLRELTGSPPPGGYQRLYTMAVDGVLPTVQRNGRLFIKDTDIAQVAGMLGLTLKAKQQAV